MSEVGVFVGGVGVVTTEMCVRKHDVHDVLHLKIFGRNVTFPETVEPNKVQSSALMDPRGCTFVVTGALLCVCV